MITDGLAYPEESKVKSVKKKNETRCKASDLAMD